MFLRGEDKGPGMGVGKFVPLVMDFLLFPFEDIRAERSDELSRQDQLLLSFEELKFGWIL
ncbi:unnamed protein product, partial [marine sediment metagenome]